MNHKKELVSDIVFKTIEEKIISGEWGPGSKITSELQLAKDLNVSRMSVREAIEKMVALNILTKRKGDGTFVNDLGPSIYFNRLLPMLMLDQSSYLEILEFRLSIEVQSVQLCVKRCSEEDISELERYYNLMIEYQNDSEKFAEADMNFHMKIAEGSKNSLIIKINSILKNLLMYHQKQLYHNLGPSGGLSEHKKILEAVKDRDEELSALFMKRHIERTIRDLQSK